MGIGRLLSKIDGRYFLFGSHLTLFWVALVEYGLPRTTLQLTTAYITAIVVELVLHYGFKKYPNATWQDRTLSAVAEAAGLILLIRSTIWYYYALISLVAVAAKYLFLRRDGVHLFNPTNFAIVFGLVIFQSRFFQLYPDEYSLHIYPIVHVIVLGSLAVWFGRTYMVTIGYFCGFLIWGLFAQLVNDAGFYRTVLPEAGAFGMIFAFLMITDPKTTPKQNRLQLIFGCVVAFGVMILRGQKMAFPHFISLFIVTISMYLLSYVFPQIYKKAVKPIPAPAPLPAASEVAEPITVGG